MDFSLPVSSPKSPKDFVRAGSPHNSLYESLLTPPQKHVSRQPASQYQPFILCNRFSASYSFIIFLLSVFFIVSSTVEQISLPLFLSTFGTNVAAYFVLWFTAAAAVVIFALLTVVAGCRGHISREMFALRWLPSIALIGILDGVSGFLIVFASSLNRVSGPLQSLLIQLVFPFSLLFSKLLLHKHYHHKQFIATAIIILGVIFALVPTFSRLNSDSDASHISAWYWPLLYLLGTVPIAIMFIVQERFQEKFKLFCESSTQKRFSTAYFQFLQSLFQLIFISICFGADLIPSFGTSANLSDLLNGFNFDFQCFLGLDSAVGQEDRCQFYSFFLGALFVFSYTLTCVFSTQLTSFSSANYLSSTNIIPPVFTLLFWYLAPSVHAWAGGNELTAMDAGFHFGSLSFLVFGSIYFKKYEVEDKRPDFEEVQAGGVEICC